MGIMLGKPGVTKDQGGVRGVNDIKTHLLVMVSGEEETHRSADVCDIGQSLSIQRVGHHRSLELYGRYSPLSHEAGVEEVLLRSGVN